MQSRNFNQIFCILIKTIIILINQKNQSFEDAVDLLRTKYSDKVETIYAIGGASVYARALECSSDFLDKIYLTRVYSSETECDVFLQPENFLDSFEKLTDVNELNEHFDTEFNAMLAEPANNLEYIFEVYQKRNQIQENNFLTAFFFINNLI